MVERFRPLLLPSSSERAVADPLAGAGWPPRLRDRRNYQKQARREPGYDPPGGIVVVAAIVFCGRTRQRIPGLRLPRPEPGECGIAEQHPHPTLQSPGPRTLRPKRHPQNHTRDRMALLPLLHPPMRPRKHKQSRSTEFVAGHCRQCRCQCENLPGRSACRSHTG